MILTVTANPAMDVAYFVKSFNMGNVHRPIKTVMSAGGKGLNVARVARALGERVTAMGFIGGSNGNFIRTEAEKLGIRCAFTEIQGETRRNIDIIDANGNTGELLETGPEISAQEESSFVRAYCDEVDFYDVICISGSLPGGLSGDFYCKLIGIAKEKGKKVIVDTSQKTLESVIKAKPYMIKPNRDELTSLFGEKTDVKDALVRLYNMGIEVPFTTLGGDGAALFDENELYKFDIPKIQIKNTVGSGDSTVAGVAVGLCRGMQLRDCVRLGMASGMSNAQSEQSGVVSLEAVEKFYREIKIVKGE